MMYTLAITRSLHTLVKHAPYPQVNVQFRTLGDICILSLVRVCFVLLSTCVSRCPPRSFPNQSGVCWPCHESCETCAGAGQDSCLTCAPAHLLVTDLAICLQQCPEGYYESMNITCILTFICIFKF